jgi:hypothetical protein
MASAPGKSAKAIWGNRLKVATMTTITTIGLDIAKRVFQAHGADANGRTVLQKKLRREEVLKFFSDLPRCLVGMEACASSHHWAGEIAAWDCRNFCV